ncbi:hypothetical protein FISHEDRAFT_75864 [Fistulina hepatica ATCC 64428]|uniref:HMG box domain-containing protein n=1 Tax=Fistulina hepatica ATCC 64428 TaxID=1128425 RepID=A0A0D7A4R9_9AGAR|nr:hypothetical protein FISHEDRAFT_75864 [Fistulina hepatica ATCC 64428]
MAFSRSFILLLRFAHGSTPNLHVQFARQHAPRMPASRSQSKGHQAKQNAKPPKKPPATKSGPKAPRPRNAWIIFRSEEFQRMKDASPGGVIQMPQSQVSATIAEKWRNIPVEDRAYYDQLAEREKLSHMLKYPQYKYHPVQKEEKARIREEKAREKERQRLERTAGGSSGQRKRAMSPDEGSGSRSESPSYGLEQDQRQFQRLQWQSHPPESSPTAGPSVAGLDASMNISIRVPAPPPTSFEDIEPAYCDLGPSPPLSAASSPVLSVIELSDDDSVIILGSSSSDAEPGASTSAPRGGGCPQRVLSGSQDAQARGVDAQDLCNALAHLPTPPTDSQPLPQPPPPLQSQQSLHSQQQPSVPQQTTMTFPQPAPVYPQQQVQQFTQHVQQQAALSAHQYIDPSLSGYGFDTSTSATASGNLPSTTSEPTPGNPVPLSAPATDGWGLWYGQQQQPLQAQSLVQPMQPDHVQQPQPQQTQLQYMSQQQNALVPTSMAIGDFSQENNSDTVTFDVPFSDISTDVNELTAFLQPTNNPSVFELSQLDPQMFPVDGAFDFNISMNPKMHNDLLQMLDFGFDHMDQQQQITDSSVTSTSAVTEVYEGGESFNMDTESTSARIMSAASSNDSALWNAFMLDDDAVMDGQQDQSQQSQQQQQQYSHPPAPATMQNPSVQRDYPYVPPAGAAARASSRRVAGSWPGQYAEQSFMNEEDPQQQQAQMFSAMPGQQMWTVPA